MEILLSKLNFSWTLLYSVGLTLIFSSVTTSTKRKLWKSTLGTLWWRNFWEESKRATLTSLPPILLKWCSEQVMFLQLSLPILLKWCSEQVMFLQLSLPILLKWCSEQVMFLLLSLPILLKWCSEQVMFLQLSLPILLKWCSEQVMFLLLSLPILLK